MKLRLLMALCALGYMSAGALAAPDLIVQSIALDPAGAPAGDGTIEIVFENIGPDDVNLSFTEYTNYTVKLDGVECDDGFIGDLDAGETNGESTNNCSPTTPGPHEITVFIDSDFDVTESNETNNESTQTFVWGGPDLTIQSVTLDPSSPPVGTGDLDIVFENIGSASVDLPITEFTNYTVQLDGVQCDSGSIFDLGAGNTNGESTSNCNPTTPGQHTITVTIDSDFDVAETNENNNIWTGTFTWTGADLVVQSITLDPTSPAPNVGTGDLQATFTNIGTADVDLSLTEFTNYTVALDGVECDSGTITDLSVGETNVENLSNNCRPETTGPHTITVTIDTDQDVAETNENNNSSSETFTWSGPDLVITQIVLDPPGAKFGEGKLIATVENTGPYGTGTFVNINITMFLDGVECDTGLVIAGLGAGNTATEESTKCNPDTAGPHLVKFVVDTDEDVAELDETNNELEVTIAWTETGDCGPELCNGLDDDCDGMVDEDFAQQLGDSCTIEDCASDGTYACGPAGDLICVTALDDDDEICDGEDNDCDGEIDEVWSELDTACTAGAGACANEGVYICNPSQDDITCDAEPLPTSGVETCDNGIDDDCDGSVDEDCGCEAGETQECGTDIGVCKKGEQACVDGTFSSVCAGEVPAGDEELCDGLDNDCDGDVDEGCNCDDPGAQPCPNGTVCDTTTGACVEDTSPEVGPEVGPESGPEVNPEPGPEPAPEAPSDTNGAETAPDIGGDGGLTVDATVPGGGGSNAADDGCASSTPGRTPLGGLPLFAGLLALVVLRRRR